MSWSSGVDCVHLVFDSSFYTLLEQPVRLPLRFPRRCQGSGDQGPAQVTWVHQADVWYGFYDVLLSASTSP